MKYTQRLDYGRLAEVLHERGLANLDAIRELLQLSQDGGMPFCEALVTSNLVSDWDLSKVVCETFQLPFLPVDLIEPNPEALEEVDQGLFRKHQLVPVDLFGQVLTVAMPSLVPAEVLAQVAAMTDFVVLPLVGTVESNRRWINEHMASTAGPSPDVEGGWESMFDAADAEVSETSTPGVDAGLSVLDDPLFGGEGDGALSTPQGLDLGVADSAIELPITEELDLGAIEALPLDDLETEPLPSDPLGDALSEVLPDDPAPDGGGLPDLPPMPEFNPDQREAS